MPDPQPVNRVRYNSFVADIERDVVLFGQHVLRMIDMAVSVVTSDEDFLLDEILKMEAQSDRMEQGIMQRVIRTQAMEGPVANDALLLSSALGIVTELEKIGDEATKVAVRVRKLQGEFPYELTEALEDIAKQATTATAASIRLFTSYDSLLAAEIIQTDDKIDRAYKITRNRILERIKEEPEKARMYLRVAEIFHAIEHMADHAVDIAKRLRTCHERIPSDIVS